MNQLSASFVTQRMYTPLVTLSFLDVGRTTVITDYAAATTKEQFAVLMTFSVYEPFVPFGGKSIAKAAEKNQQQIESKHNKQKKRVERRRKLGLREF